MMLGSPTRSFTLPVALAAAALLGGLGGATAAHAQVPGGAGSTGRPAPTTPPPTTPPTGVQPVSVGDLTEPGDDGPDLPVPPPAKGPAGLLAEAPISLPVLLQQLQSGVLVNGGTVGWAYRVSRDGQMVGGNAGGFARTPNDGNDDADGIKFTVNTRIELMSATKPITAMAILKALDAAHVSVDAPVRPYLPATWLKGPGFALNSAKPVTFRHLLTHTSGILQAFQNPNIDHAGWGNTWDGLKPLVKQGVTPDVPKGEQYKNANYALLRVMLPKLWAKADGPKTPVTESNHGFRYLDYVNAKILAPAGVPYTRCWENFDDSAAHVYNKGDLGIGGSLVEYTDNANECGGHRGLHLSVTDLVRLTARLRESHVVLPSAVRASMFDGRLGWSTASNRTGTESANIWWHAGDGFFGGGREVHTCVMNAPQHYQLSMIFNAQFPGKQSPCRILLNAVNAARTAS